MIFKEIETHLKISKDLDVHKHLNILYDLHKFLQLISNEAVVTHNSLGAFGNGLFAVKLDKFTQLSSLLLHSSPNKPLSSWPDYWNLYTGFLTSPDQQLNTGTSL